MRQHAREWHKGMTYLELHPWQGLAAKHIKQALSFGKGKCGEIDDLQDTALLPLQGALPCAEALASAGSDDSAWKVVVVSGMDRYLSDQTYRRSGGRGPRAWLARRPDWLRQPSVRLHPCPEFGSPARRPLRDGQRQRIHSPSAGAGDVEGRRRQRAARRPERAGSSASTSLAFALSKNRDSADGMMSRPYITAGPISPPLRGGAFGETWWTSLP